MRFQGVKFWRFYTWDDSFAVPRIIEKKERENARKLYEQR